MPLSPSSFSSLLNTNVGMLLITSTSQLFLLVAFLLAVLIAIVARKHEAPAPDDPLSHEKDTAPAIEEQKDSESEMGPSAALTDIDWTAVKQPYDAYLVLDVEATCMPGTDFNYANEIIVSALCRAARHASLTHILFVCIRLSHTCTFICWCRNGPCACSGGSTRTKRARQAGSRSSMSSAPSSSPYGGHSSRPSVPL